MPYANREDKLANGRARYERDGAKMRAEAINHYYKNRDRICARRKQLRTPEARKRDTAAMARRHKALRKEMIEAYGGKCQCCGEDEPLFLELDHIKNDGHKHRRTIGRGSGVTYRTLKKAGWPRGDYQLLCANCNAGKARNGGVCPHGR